LRWAGSYFIRADCRFILWFVEKLRSDPALVVLQKPDVPVGAGTAYA